MQAVGERRPGRAKRIGRTQQGAQVQRFGDHDQHARDRDHRLHDEEAKPSAFYPRHEFSGDPIEALEHMFELFRGEPDTVVAHAELRWPEGGALQHAAYKGLRMDKNAREVVKETPNESQR